MCDDKEEFCRECTPTVANGNVLTTNKDFYTKRLRSLSAALFSRSGKFDVCLIAFSGTSQPWPEIRYLEDESMITNSLEDTKQCSMRIMSFFQDFSLTPLKCSQSTMMQAIYHMKAGTMIFDLLFKFGNQPQVFEESSCLTSTKFCRDGSFELCYQLVYVEPNGKRPPKDPWSLRQTGVYQRYSRKDNTSVSILFHPMRNASAQKRLENLAVSSLSEERESLEQHPLGMHLLILSSYLNHWQAYLEALVSKFTSLRDDVMIVDVARPVQCQLRPDMLQTLRNLQDKVMFRACASLRGSIKIVEMLNETNCNLVANDAKEDTSVMQQEFRSYTNRLESHLSNAESLSQRIEATIGLLANLLDLRNQGNSDEMNRGMLQLTRESVDDNATVRVITVFTLIYLPASFTATILGMNLFDFKEDSGLMQISPNFWIYIAATLPLTALTLITWYLFKMRHDKKRRQSREQAFDA